MLSLPAEAQVCRVAPDGTIIADGPFFGDSSTVCSTFLPLQPGGRFVGRTMGPTTTGQSGPFTTGPSGPFTTGPSGSFTTGPLGPSTTSRPAPMPSRR
jgi:hypothetical protein